jgi:hypothetical protein
VTSRWLPIVLAAVAFGLTLAIENWPTSNGPTGNKAAPASRPHGPAASWALWPLSPRSHSAAEATPRPGLEPAFTATHEGGPADDSPSGTPSEGEPKDPEPSELRAPALVLLTPPEGQSPQIATFENLGPGRPTFTISTMDASGAIHSSIQVQARPHQRQVLNDRGLVILPGDRILVHSPPYQDFSIDAY